MCLPFVRFLQTKHKSKPRKHESSLAPANSRHPHKNLDKGDWNSIFLSTDVKMVNKALGINPKPPNNRHTDRKARRRRLEFLFSLHASVCPPSPPTPPSPARTHAHEHEHTNTLSSFPAYTYTYTTYIGVYVCIY